MYFVIIILDLTFVASKFPARGRPRQWQWRLSIVAFHQDERLPPRGRSQYAVCAGLYSTGRCSVRLLPHRSLQTHP
ncbi:MULTISPECIES: hypothetical protein [unclassified Mesorhizobium]|uniref:hypothetical protein n=1 Tax=unclassified Mesorhizobium TaxID=325217 RepID=UPI000FCA0AE5|nr:MULTISPECIES: hypothetical protein [unclassified Mesorhizobium]RUV39423.1 hypothetical protein EOB77_35535 [Mesorhizobium sp. M7A.F.Ca.MR.228.00.0.0]AZV19337.1 hypothetical protein EJ079_09715 [Mesorhizobium sp. M7A.F.Ce.TU.012.03.2.1]RUV17077.1 hypothetical protein EOB80_28750 [Mesorhizobium sp. M7A.F.Ca.MR.245.00.0.0]RUV34147.1 hypothetical protein EOB49_27310 [Mesorhizobium sp. M7A.F.Ca.MR.148.00.0.0]RWN08971.1 MAG: hypothetical protein EOR94_30460 [Mesorhizobium sp.]